MRLKPQRGVHRAGSLLGHARQKVRISIERHGDGRVPEEFLDVFGVDALGEQQRGAGVPEVMQGYARQARAR